MSQKITSKNLQYNSTLPPFLARLRGQNAAETDPDGPDPILASRRRPVKPRSGSAEAEDAPLVVDEHGNAVDVTVGTDGSVKEKEEQKEGQGNIEETDKNGADGKPTDAELASGEKLAGIGDQRRKRKIGRVVGGGADEEEADVKRDKKDDKQEPRKTDNKAEARNGAKEQNHPAPAAKAKPKKAKKIKLSFGDDET